MTGVLYRSCSENFPKNLRERPLQEPLIKKFTGLKGAKLLKETLGHVFFLSISQNISEKQFCRAPLGDYFFHLKGVADFLSS